MGSLFVVDRPAFRYVMRSTGDMGEALQLAALSMADNVDSVHVSPNPTAFR
jgi:hypothetical protein